MRMILPILVPRRSAETTGSRILAAGLVAVLALLLSLTEASFSLAQAAETVGMLSMERGTVKLRRNGKERFIEAKDGLVPVEEGDALHSGSGARGSVYFERENQKVEVYPGSMIQVKAFSPRGTSFFMPLGKALFSVLNKLRSDQRFEVSTPTATIGVKGTEFVLGTDGVSKTFLLTVAGVVSIVNTEFPNMETLVPKDQATVSERGAPPAPPVVVPPETRNTVIQEDSIQTMEALPVQTQSSGGETSKKEEKSGDEEQSQEESTSDESSQDTTESTAESKSESTTESNAATTASVSDSASAASTANVTASLAEVVSTVQATTETVSTATTTITNTCGGTAGCGKMRFTW